MKKLVLFISVMSFFSIGAFARGGGQGRELQKAACSAKSVGDSCSFEGKKGSVSGTCSESRKSADVLICKNKEAKERRNKRKE